MKHGDLTPGDIIRWRWPDVANRQDEYFVVINKDNDLVDVFNITLSKLETVSAISSYLVRYGELV